MRTIILVLAILFSGLITCGAQNLDKAFTFFNAGDYAMSIEIFHKILLKEPENPVAAFGLAKAFFSKENRHYNLDSANYYAIKSAAGLKKTWKERDQKKFMELGYREFTVNELQDNINKAAFMQADTIDELDSWNHFINTFTTSDLVDEAIENRNVLAFNEAMKNGDYASYEEFLKNYPDARQVKEAKALYESQLYKTKTADSTWQSYKSFLDKYPKSPYAATAKVNYERLLFLDKTKSHQLQDYLVFLHDYPKNPYVPIVEDSIYSVSTRNHTTDQYLSFISLFPSNRNVNKAWEEVYRLENPVYNYQSFKRFSEKYRAFPNKQALEKDLNLTRRIYVPFQKDGLYGFADSADFKIKIIPQFAEAAPFSEGLSAVQLPCGNDQCYYSYVNMEGQVISNYAWSEANDFHDGLALAAIGNCSKDSCLYGFINRFGEWVIAPQYSDAFEFSDGFALVKKEQQGYGFIDKSGRVVIELKYPDAASFSEGVACVQVNDSAALFGYMDQYGKWAIEPRFTKAGSFAESLAPAANEKKIWGYVDHTGNWVIQPKFESALPFEKGIAKVVIKSKDPKNSKLFLMKEKTIDKKGKVL